MPVNSDLIKEKAAEPQHTYIKSPAGIFTETPTLPDSYAQTQEFDIPSQAQDL